MFFFYYFLLSQLFFDVVAIDGLHFEFSFELKKLEDGNYFSSKYE